MARNFEADEGAGKGQAGRHLFIDALLAHRKPRIDEVHLLKKIESRTAQHRSPFSANISRKHASILSAMAPEGAEQPKIGRHKTLTPSREASRREAFEVFEWEREKEPLVPEERADTLDDIEEAEVPFKEWDGPRPAIPKYLASLKRDDPRPEDESGTDAVDDPDNEVPVEEGTEDVDAAVEEAPEVVPEAEDDWDDRLVEYAKAISAYSGQEEPRADTPTETASTTPTDPEPAPEVAEPAVEGDGDDEDTVVVEGRPSHQMREGGDFPTELMEDLDDSATESTAKMDLPRRDEDDEEETSILSYEHEMDLSDELEASPGETETTESVVGIAPSTRWPSDTGLELHIDGFEHISATSDLCPRCGRRIAARNRLLTCSDCGTVACESCEIKTSANVDSPYYYDWKFQMPLCIPCYDKAFSIQKMLAKAKASMGMGNLTYAFYHAQQALRTDPSSPYAEDAKGIISQVDKRRAEAAEQDEAWKRQRSKMSRTTVVHEDEE